MKGFSRVTLHTRRISQGVEKSLPTITIRDENLGGKGTLSLSSLSISERRPSPERETSPRNARRGDLSRRRSSMKGEESARHCNIFSRRPSREGVFMGLFHNIEVWCFSHLFQDP